MGRKKTAPQQMGEEQRQQMEWNMLENVPSASAPATAPGSLLIIANDDPVLEREREAVETEQDEENVSNGIGNHKRFLQEPSVENSLLLLASPKLEEENNRADSTSKKSTGDFATAQEAFPGSMLDFFRTIRTRVELKELVSGADFILPAYSPDHPRTLEVKQEWHWQAGTFTVTLLDHSSRSSPSGQSLSRLKECWLYFTVDDRDKDFIYFEVYDSETERESREKIESEKRNSSSRFVRLKAAKSAVEDQLGLFWLFKVDLEAPWNIFRRISKHGRKRFHLEFRPVGGAQLRMTLFGRKETVDTVHHPSERLAIKEGNFMLQDIMRAFYSLGPPVYKAQATRTFHDFHELHREMKTLQNSQKFSLDVNVQHPSLKPRLRLYQKDAVRWMLHRERYGMGEVADQEELHSMYSALTTECGKTLYYNRHGGRLLSEKPRAVTSPPGGILADEMGLGKTVEVLCCMLLHPRPNVPLPQRLPTLQEIELDSEDESSMEGLSSVTETASPASGSKLVETPSSSDSSSLSNDAAMDTSAEADREHRDSAAEVSNPLPGASGDPSLVFRAHDRGDSLKSESGAVRTVSVPLGDVLPPVSGAGMVDALVKSEEESATTADNRTVAVVGDRTPAMASPFTKCEGSTLSFTRKEPVKVLCDESEEPAKMDTDNDILTSASPSVEGAATEKAEAKPEEEFKTPFDVGEPEPMLQDENEGCDTPSDEEKPRSPQPRGRKRQSRAPFVRRRKSVTARKKVAETLRGMKRKSATPDDPSTGDEKKAKQKSRFVTYITEEEFQQRHGTKPLLVPQKQMFECVCGKTKEGESRILYGRRKKQNPVVTCQECHTSQHAQCLHYDLDDPFRGPYKCPHCHYHGKTIPSGATLIVSPFSICHQWSDEIKKHVRESSIKVFVYTGVSQLGYVQPQRLASQDIVITTYETLRRELNYVDLPHSNSDAGRRLRNPKKFMALPTPLTAVQWWRICLDEAQMVECVTTKTAEMALRLSCVNRWCVTGTPLNHSVDDVFGLLAFLGFDPYCVDVWWRTLLLKPYLHWDTGPLVTALASVMWRNSMKDVKEQLDLPLQTEEVYRLTFSPVEEVFYRRLYQSCADEINWAAAKFLQDIKGSTTLHDLGQATVARFFRPLIKLRQACCHPQAVKGSFIAVQESMLTMEQLLDNLIKKSMLECMESHRLTMAAMNGQAGILLIQQPPQVCEAVAMYRAVLMSVEEHERKQQFKTDALPHLHTLHNLKAVLDSNPAGVHPTLRDEQLGKQCADLKQEYMQRARNSTAASREQLAPSQQDVRDLTQELKECVDWYVDVMSHANLSGNGPELIRKVQEETSSFTVKKGFRNMAGLQYVLETGLQEVAGARGRLLVEMQGVDRLDLKDRSVLDTAIDCCLRPAGGVILKNCAFCQLSDTFENLEVKLFDLTIEDRYIRGVEQSYRKGTWKDGVLETTLKAVLSFARNHHVGKSLSQAGSTHIRLFDAWKKEFKLLRALWVRLREETSAVDELEMAVMRMRLRQPGEATPGEWDLNVREETELGSLLKKYEIDQKVHTAELRTKCGTLEYLKNLAKGKQGEFKDGINPDQCPICKEELGRNWCVLQCGHCFCMDCMQLLVDKSRAWNMTFKCAFCRERMTPKDISYVSTSRPESDNFSPSVKGSHSTKVAAVVQCVINVQREEPGAKVLIFATWVDMLKLIGKALEENEINYTNLFEHGPKFDRNLTRFKESREICVLLMPYGSGSKGLNLFEANHVLLVEPTLNPAHEAQAIGRIYRMGQTRPTKVHRFLIQRTIEERIQCLTETVLRPACERSDSTTDHMTIQQLISLFEDCHDKKGDNDDEDGDGRHSSAAFSSRFRLPRSEGGPPSSSSGGVSSSAGSVGAGPSGSSSRLSSIINRLSSTSAGNAARARAGSPPGEDATNGVAESSGSFSLPADTVIGNSAVSVSGPFFSGISAGVTVTANGSSLGEDDARASTGSPGEDSAAQVVLSSSSFSLPSGTAVGDNAVSVGGLFLGSTRGGSPGEDAAAQVVQSSGSFSLPSGTVVGDNAESVSGPFLSGTSAGNVARTSGGSAGEDAISGVAESSGSFSLPSGSAVGNSAVSVSRPFLSSTVAGNSARARDGSSVEDAISGLAETSSNFSVSSDNSVRIVSEPCPGDVTVSINSHTELSGELPDDVSTSHKS